MFCVKIKKKTERISDMSTFRNPISPFSAPDPFITYDKESGYYYSLFTRGKLLEIFRGRHAAKIITEGESKIIYIPFSRILNA